MRQNLWKLCWGDTNSLSRVIKISCLLQSHMALEPFPNTILLRKTWDPKRKIAVGHLLNPPTKRGTMMTGGLGLASFGHRQASHLLPRKKDCDLLTVLIYGYICYLHIYYIYRVFIFQCVFIVPLFKCLVCFIIE